ncbi:MAG: hypothetical protein ACK2UH_03800, partial [Candidatus Promineifilaceae bacterium]
MMTVEQAAADTQAGGVQLTDAKTAVTQAGALQLTDAQAVVAQAVPGADLIDGAPHYFSHANYANSPLPTVTAIATPVGNDVFVDRANATDSTPDILVVLNGSPLPTGFLTSFQIRNQAGTGSFHAYVLRPVARDLYSVVFDSGQLAVPALTTSGVSEQVTYGVANLAVQAGDLLAFYGRGIPYDDVKKPDSDFISVPSVIPARPLQGSIIELGGSIYPDYKTARKYSFAAEVIEPAGLNIAGGLTTESTNIIQLF